MENTRPKIANDGQRKQCSREITTKTKQTPHHPYLRRYCHVLAARIAGEPPAFRGKPRFCEKNTVKRRKEKNDERKQVNGKRLGSRIALRLKFPAYYPPLGAAAAGIQLPIGQGTHIWGNVLRCYARRGPTREDPLTVSPVKLRPFATNCNDHLVLRIITGGCTNIAYVDVAHCCCFSL